MGKTPENRETQTRLDDLLRKGQEFKRQMEQLDMQIEDDSVIEQSTLIHPQINSIQQNIEAIQKVGHALPSLNPDL